ncbi:MAG: 2-oxo acid dehydrogenase subunit E2, partial [Xanthomonadaceae bacterium]|nr:2-oxo acid dehydrogenase subunit E2 [Xanthomonadaceae bacterium]
MSNVKTFHLPDLGEGLPDATIVEWLVKEGDSIKLDAPLVSMETAKAVVEVPSPYTGKVLKMHGKAGDVIDTGAALAEFELDPNAKQRAENAA